LQESIAEPLQGNANARYFGQIDSHAQNHGG
jgi:hypothetical protein